MKIIETKSISKLIGKYFCITIDKYNIDQIEYKLKMNGFLEDSEWNEMQKKEYNNSHIIVYPNSTVEGAKIKKINEVTGYGLHTHDGGADIEIDGDDFLNNYK